MNIYEFEGVDVIVDLHKATTELRSSGMITNDVVRKSTVAEIQTAALLDIALSLRVVAAEARAAMPDASLFAQALEGMHEDVADDRERDFLIEGDLVAINGMDETAEVIGFGQSEGAIYATLRLDDGAETRAWLDGLTRVLPAVTGEAGGEGADDAPEPVAGDVAPVSGAIEISAEPDSWLAAHPEFDDDIDSDFDGDSHPAAASALDVLKANEAERKAGKKKGGKK